MRKQTRELIADIQGMAERIGAVFIPDASKIRAFEASQQCRAWPYCACGYSQGRRKQHDACAALNIQHTDKRGA